MGMESAFRLLGILIIALITVYTLFKDDKTKIAWLAFIGSFDYFAVQIGVVWEPGKIVGFALLLFVLTRWREYLRPLALSNLQILAFYFAYVVAITLFQAQTWPQSEYLPDAFLYNEGRFLVQFSRILIGLAVICVAWQACSTEGSIRFIVRATVFAAFVLAAYAIYQIAALKLGLPTNSITRSGGSEASSDVVVSVIGNRYVERAYSLAGEPKALAAVLSLAIVLLILLPAKYIFPRHSRTFAVIALAFTVPAFVLTYSTAGYIMIAIGMAFVGVSLFFFGYRRRSMRILIAAPLLLVVASVVLGGTSEVSVEEVAEDRLMNRVEGGAGLTYADRSIIETWSSRPDLLILGAGLGGSSFYVRQYSKKYAGFTAAPRGVLGRIGDTGLVGLALWILAVGLLYVRCMKIRFRTTSVESMAVLVFCSYSLIMVVTFSTWYVEWLLYGTMAGLSARTVRSQWPEVSEVDRANSYS